ncbi:MAG: tRNA (guanosine(37)-N1)-methyltransferase TrmD [Eubacterium sp.]|nr:tRNA (guanosine(37)-N1)-methyltransferase TrmD [Eubacterium sp.]
MNYQVVTLFPEMIQETVQNSVIGRAIRNGLISVDTVSIRAFSTNKHMRVDDYPYGGGAGMVMEAEPVWQAVQCARARTSPETRVIYLTPQAEVLTQTKVEELSLEKDLILLCGHYEGIDERVLEEVVTDYISIGDYVMTGGELGALVLIDAVSRFVPGVLGNETSADFESLQDNLLEYPHFTRPEIWHGKPVPEILLSGDHRKVEEWRHGEAVRRTRERRPDLLKKSYAVTCIWTGSEAAERHAAQLTQELTRYGTILNYNRRTLQRKRRRFAKQDFLVLVTDQDPEPCLAALSQIAGDQTPCAVVDLSGVLPAERAVPESGEGAVSSLSIPWKHLEELGFRCVKILRGGSLAEDPLAIRRSALELRRLLEKR